MKKNRVWKKTFYCEFCGTKMQGICDDPTYHALTGKPSPYIYDVKCPNWTEENWDHFKGGMYHNGQTVGR